MKTILAALFLSVAFFNAAQASDTNNTIYIGILTSGDSSEEVSSYIKNELNNLNNVVVTDEIYRARINVALTTLKMDGQVSGYAASCVLTLGQKNQSAVFIAQEVIVENSLQKIAKDIVTDFDTKILEKDRKTFSKPAL